MEHKFLLNSYDDEVENGDDHGGGENCNGDADDNDGDADDNDGDDNGDDEDGGDDDDDDNITGEILRLYKITVHIKCMIYVQLAYNMDSQYI